MAAQIQANLEHYQQAVQQQQQELHLAKEKQYAIYAQELSQLKKLLDDANLRCTHSEKSLAASQYEHQQLLQKYDHQSIQHEKLADKHHNDKLKNVWLFTPEIKADLEEAQKHPSEPIQLGGHEVVLYGHPVG